MANWKIESMVVKPVDGAYTDCVVTAAWRCTAVDGDHSASNYGSMGFASPSGDFIAYPDLTEADVLGWVWANGVNKAEVEANVARELDMQVNPPVVAKPLPWSEAA
jgi:hypothetical protein